MTSKAAIEGLPATPSNAANRAHMVRLGVDASQTRMVGPNEPQDVAAVNLNLVHPLTGPVFVDGAKRGVYIVPGLLGTILTLTMLARTVRAGLKCRRYFPLPIAAEDVDRISHIRPRSMGFPRLPASSSALLRRKTRPIARGTRSNFFERFGAQ
jgi:Acetamidase/Formamidase family